MFSSRMQGPGLTEEDLLLQWEDDVGQFFRKDERVAMGGSQEVHAAGPGTGGISGQEGSWDEDDSSPQ